MELWISGEISKDVAKPFQLVSNDIERKINKLISRKDYGDGLESWDVIVIIAGPEWPVSNEVRKYSKRTKDCEYRIKADHEKFLKGPKQIQTEMLFRLLRSTVEDLGRKQISNFAFEQLLEDLDLLAAKHNW